MSVWLFLVAAVALSLERSCYVLVWRHPEAFRTFCQRPRLAHSGDPVAILQKLFYCFKAVQLTVFLGWCYHFANGSLWPFDGVTWPLVVGGALAIAGQVLNLSVFYRLGNIGVFYGNRFGYEIPWSREFPFSFFEHPQYVGALVSIWGLFVAARFPHEDWWVIPVLETVYYIVGAHFEAQPPPSGESLVCAARTDRCRASR